MAYRGYETPVNGVVAAGEPQVQFLKVETATNMFPGRLVIKGTNQDDIVVATADELVIGWLGYEHAHPGYQGATVDTAYSASDWVPVLNGGGFVINARKAASGTIVKGDLLTWGTTAGDLTKATAGTHHVLASAEEDKGAAAADILVRSLI